MILYIGEKQDESFVTEIGKGVTDEIRMITTIHTLKELLENVQAIPYSYLIINIMCIQDDPDALIKQLKYIQTKINSNLIIIASGLLTNDPMVQSLYFAGIKNVIITSWFPHIASQCVKYLCGTYQETELLEEEGQQTTKLDLKQIYKDDPVILEQLEELERERENEKKQQELEKQEGTRKLTPEELFSQGGDVAAQVKEYEEERYQQEQSTTLYQQENAAKNAAAYKANPYEQQEQPFSPYAGASPAEPSQEAKQIPIYPLFEQNLDTTYSPNPKAKKKKQNEKQPLKKSRKPIIITACLCAILLISIAVPVLYTVMDGKKKANNVDVISEGKKQLGGAGTTESTPAPSSNNIVVGAVPDGTVSPVPSTAVNASPDHSEDPMSTLTPIKGQEIEEKQTTAEPVKPLEPVKTKEPDKTIAPTKQPAPTETPKPTKKPEKKIIKITSLVLPTTVSVDKGRTYQIDLSYSPSNANESVTWSSSNSSVASVSNGMLRAKKKGKVTVTVKTQSGVKTSCSVEIY